MFYGAGDVGGTVAVVLDVDRPEVVGGGALGDVTSTGVVADDSGLTDTENRDVY